MNEIDYLMRLDQGGVIEFGGNDGAIAQIREWLDTPQGQVWGKPQWGNLLSQFKHEPMDEITEVAMENTIMLTIKSDLPRIDIGGIRVKCLDIDAYKITIMANGEIFNGDLTL